MRLKNFLLNLSIAYSALIGNKIRSFLTALGIIFGVAAVIAMLSIGRGAKQEILEQIELVGVNNIVVQSVFVQDEQEEESENATFAMAGNKKNFSPGLNMLDVLAIQEVIPNVKRVSPEIQSDVQILRKGRSMNGRLIGVESTFFDINNLPVVEGSNFTSVQSESGTAICIIGHNVKKKFFGNEDAIGKTIKCGREWYKVVGVLQPREMSEAAITNLGLRDYNNDVYIPLKTYLLRVKNRAKVNVNERGNFGGNIVVIGGPSNDQKKKNYHQLDKLVVQVDRSEYLQPTAEIIGRMLERRHNGMVDFEITVPELLLKQQQKTKNIFNVVLGAIAGISLLVGGIGIMNIMLASVMERIKEIGIRLAIGAKKQDIISQFILEAILISLSGGILGVIIGVGLAYSISYFADILTIISFFSIILSFGISFLVGLIFGIAPARRAAQQDPIQSLRYE